MIHALLLATFSLALADDPEQFDLRQWTIRDGLPQNSVTDLAQSSDGYLWLTTFGGIVRFDGARFVTYDLSTNPELGSERFTRVVEDGEGRLWFSAGAGGLVTLLDGVFERVTLPESAPGNVTDLRASPEGIVWVRVGDALLKASGGALEVVADAGMLGDGDFYVEFDTDGALWSVGVGSAACWEGPCGHPREVVPADPALSGRQPDPVETIRWSTGWAPPAACPDMAGESRFRWYRVQRWGERVWCVGGDTFQSGDVFVPFVGEGGGVPPGFNVTDLLTDREGALWVGTAGSGLFQLRDLGVQRYGEHQGLTGAAARRLVEAGPGRVWVLASYALSLLEDGESVPLPAPLSELGEVLSMAGAGDGALWILVPGRLLRYADGALTEVSYGGIEGYGRELIADDRGEIWLSSPAVSVRLSPTGPVERWSEEELGGHLKVVRYTSDGAMWVGTSGGVTRLHEGSVMALTVDDGLSAGVVRELLVEEDDTIWVGTYGGGLSRVRGAEIDRLSVSDGLCESVISRIIRTGDGSLWMNGNRGVSHVRLEDLHAAADGALRAVQCELFDTGEGNGNDGMIAADGALWFPTIIGPARLDPSVQAAPVIPLPRIERMEMDAAPLSEGVSAPPGRGDLVVRYTGLGLYAPEGLSFRHRLIGYDDAWRLAVDERVARYTNLPPGSYHFEVQVRGLRGDWSASELAAFSLRPFFYQTSWFAALCALLLVTTIWVVVAARVRSVRRHADERLAMQAQLQQSQKLEALGQLAGGIAHDFNNLLTVIGTNAVFLQEVVPLAEREVADDIRDAVKRAKALTAKLLIFARREITALQVLPLQESTTALLGVLRRLIPEDISLEVDSGPTPRWIRADPVRFEQIVMNLVVNARDAIEGGGVIRVGMEGRQVEAGEARRYGVAPGRYSVLSVSDDGEGIPPEVQARIFEPFFTTREVGKGTGMGLATVHGAVLESEGFITVESRPGEGTCFRVHFPEVAAPVVREEAPDESAALPGGDARVLICDDEPAVRRTMARMLEAVGYQVLEAESPDAALRCVHVVDLLITDVVMPGINGPELARLAREITPSLPVLYVSGHTRDILKSRGLDDNAALLDKPFSPEELLSQVAALLKQHKGDR